MKEAGPGGGRQRRERYIAVDDEVEVFERWVVPEGTGKKAKGVRAEGRDGGYAQRDKE